MKVYNAHLRKNLQTQVENLVLFGDHLVDTFGIPLELWH
jgi:hypothetical protein